MPDLVPWWGHMVSPEFRDRQLAAAREHLAECRRILRAGRPAIEVARENAASREDR